MKIGYGSNRVAIPPMAVVNIDECKFSADYIKKHYGNYVQFLTEKKQEEKADETVDVPSEAEENLAPAEDKNNVPAVNTDIAEETADGDVVDTGDYFVEDSDTDADNAGSEGEGVVDEAADKAEAEADGASEAEAAPEKKNKKSKKK